MTTVSLSAEWSSSTPISIRPAPALTEFCATSKMFSEISCMEELCLVRN